MNPWRRRPAEPPKVDEPISLEDIAWRIGASEARPPHYEEEEATALATVAAVGIGAEPPPAGSPPGQPGRHAAGATERVAAATVAPAVLQPRPLARPAQTARRNVRALGARNQAHPASGPRRLILWRDASALLFGVVAIVLIAQLALGNRGQTAVAPASFEPSPATTEVVAGATDTVTPVPTAAATLGPVINPSLIPIIVATPGPIPGTSPASTVRPTATPPPPTATPRRTTQPGPTPPPPTPTTAPTPTPVPAPPVANFTVSQACGDAPLVVMFDASTSTGADSYAWDFDHGEAGAIGDLVSHQFDGSFTSYTVVLTVTGPGGTATASTIISVPC